MNHNPEAIRRIIIVGGGSAGWMTAAYLSKALNHKKAQCDISLIETHDIPTIGVGEATIPNILQIFRFLELPEEDWMEVCNATYKMAIKFTGWYDNSPTDSYFHTFGTLGVNQGPNISHYQSWLYHHRNGMDTPFSKAVMDSVYLCESKKSPKIPFETAKNQPAYAYHLDAGLLVGVLKKFALARNVNHLIGKVDQVNLDDQGAIKSLDTNPHGRLEADLYIDCSGFASILIEKSLKEPWESYADSLFVDRAVAIGVDYEMDDSYNEKNGGLNPYTTATAHKSGWSWHTPLVSRDGNGYVYSSRFATEEQAEAEFRQFLGPRSDKAMARHLKMRVGKFKRSWVKNCVSIGLASGFIEPLESTGIALIQIAVQNLIYNFPDKQYDPLLINNFNDKLTLQYENIRDFIILHYCLTQREDTPFWKAVKYDTVLPPKLKAQIEEWKSLWPNGRMSKSLMFGPYNYVSILAGMNCLPKKGLPILSIYEQGQDYFEKVKTRGEQMAASHPTQADYFRKLKEIKAFQLDEDW